MQTEVTYPRVRAVRPLPEKKLFVTFFSGDSRIYDCQPLLLEGTFSPLKDEAFFQRVRPDQHGYEVIWSDEIDLVESKLWIHGKAPD